PGVSGFEPASLFAVAGTLGFAGRDLATRAAHVSMHNSQLGMLGFAMLAVAGVIALGWTGLDGLGDGALTDLGVWLDVTCATVIGVIAYGALTGAMRLGEISVVAPFRYTRLVFAMVLGILVFGERPDTLTLIGSAVIVASGVFTLIRSRKA
ncbi:MAG: DMT family transporter, partial [Phaeobacter gallaeciensis]